MSGLWDNGVEGLLLTLLTGIGIGRELFSITMGLRLHGTVFDVLRNWENCTGPAANFPSSRFIALCQTSLIPTEPCTADNFELTCKESGLNELLISIGIPASSVAGVPLFQKVAALLFDGQDATEKGRCEANLRSHITMKQRLRLQQSARITQVAQKYVCFVSIRIGLFFWRTKISSQHLFSHDEQHTTVVL